MTISIVKDNGDPGSCFEDRFPGYRPFDLLHRRTQHSPNETCQVFDLADKGELSFCTSPITLLEILVKPLREGKPAIADQYREILTNASAIEIIDTTTAIAEQAAKLRAKYGLRAPDAIQLATSIEVAGDMTNGIRLRSVSEIPVITRLN